MTALMRLAGWLIRKGDGGASTVCAVGIEREARLIAIERLESFAQIRQSDALANLVGKPVAGVGHEHGERVAAAQCFEPNPTARRLRLRSEEHTSELQSRSDLVCRLLL